MKKYHIEMTEEEALLVESIDLRVRHASRDEGHAAYKSNRQPILALLKSLGERDAIPRPRLRYWLDPDYNTARLKASHKGCSSGTGATGRTSTRTPTSCPISATSCSGRISRTR